MSAPARPPLVDTHAHLQDPAFADDCGEVLARAREAGLRAMVCVGYDLESSRRAVALAEQHPAIYAAVGVHPNSSGRAGPADWDEIRELARHDRVVGIGETGLDNYRKRTPPPIQEDWFRRHLALADETGRPVIIHNREADGRVREILAEWLPLRVSAGAPGVMHCFSADRAMLEACLAFGFMISIAGPVTFKTAEGLREVARAVPPGRLVVETDCPYLTPTPHRGQRNEPAYVAHTVRCLAELRGERFEDLAERTTRTAAVLFGLEIATEKGTTTP